MPLHYIFLVLSYAGFFEKILDFLNFLNFHVQKMHAINQVEQGIPALMEKYTQLQSSIEQRLKWGSGANPALTVVMENFDQAVNEKKTALMVSLFNSGVNSLQG